MVFVPKLSLALCRLLVLNTFLLEHVICQKGRKNVEQDNSNIWNQLMGIIKHSPDAPLEIKNFVSNKQLDAHGRRERICDVPCENDGICIAKDVCRCINGWSGAACTSFECTEPCLHGTCRGPDTCFCDSGWTGNTCSKPICNPSCMNRGQCIGPNECKCAHGYVGQRCQDATCDPPCGYGNCYRPNQCTCDPGWQGPLCTEPSCSPGCKNEGECTRPNDCLCSSEWRGYLCEIPVCKNRCQNGGTCVAPDECTCPPKFVGESCQIALDKEAHVGRTCTVWSSYHFRTFDGHAFDFPGLCRYDLAKDVRDGLFSIELIKDKRGFVQEGENENVNGTRNASGIISDMVRDYSGEFMAITLSIRGSKSVITLLPKRMFMFEGKLITERHFSHQGVSVELIGRYLRVKTRSGVSILWDGDGVADIEIENEQYRGGLGGLCGNFDYDPYNDLVMRDGSPVDLLYFAMTWRANDIDDDCRDITGIPVYCSNQTSDQADENHVACEVLVSNLASFQYCRDRGIDQTSFTDACIIDMCKCKMENRVECSCNALTQYSRLCAHETGIAPKWRKPDLCGVDCPVGMVYDECASSCPRTCQSLVTPETDCDEHCMDGCTCVNGTVLRHDNICVPEEECPCTHGDALYPAGHVITQNCLECRCTGALWNCKTLQCPGECSVVGASHYTTFDGMLSKIYGECQFTFTKDCSETDLFSVVVQNSLCVNDLTQTCVNDVLVMVSPISSGPGTSRTTNGEHEIQIKLGRNGRVTVGEQNVFLPLLGEHFQIFRVSSEFIHLKLNLGVTLEWDGMSRLYVKAERKWMGKLCGICGNFNDNKRDDMMNFNGLVEKSATAFSNLWKVNSDCRDATAELNLDPCIANPQRAQFAKGACSIIRGHTFRSCHPYVNPEEAELMCHQDVCQCDRGIPCLCNAIAHYARRCTKKGQIVHWRTDDFCPVICTGGQTFQQCGSSCSSTCRSISDSRARCSETCVEGCNCPQDMYLNEYKVCVPRVQCQCYHNGNVYQPFYILRREFTVCHCRDGLFTCQSSEITFKNLPKLSVHNATDCPTGWRYYRCGNGFDLLDVYPRGIECQRTCKNLDTRCIATECVAGCGCPEGLVLDSEKNTCVHKDLCPCYYSGQANYPGEVVKVGCNTCKCQRREWLCTDEPCVGTCTTYGDPHFETFDGYKYDFMGQCGYILTQDYCGNQEGKFGVYVENENCGSDGVSCAKSVTVALTRNIYIKLNKDSFGYGKKDLVTWGVLHGSNANTTTVLWDFHNIGLFTIVTTDIGLTVVWDRKATLYVKLHPRYKGRVCGLCGDFDDNQNNDMMMSDHMPSINPTEFGNSWKISAACADATEQESQCNRHPQRRIWAQRNCKILYDPVFAACHSVVDVVWYHTNCVFDACSCDNGGDCECLCTAIAAYTHACSEEGVTIRWRTDKVCPLMCEAYDEKLGDCTWHYNACGSACPKTCQHQYLADGFDSCPASVSCVEGCFPYCTDGKIFDEEQMKCVSDCGREGCHANAKYYAYGETVLTDDCRVCTCQSPGGIVCSQRDMDECIEGTTPRTQSVTSFTREPPTTPQSYAYTSSHRATYSWDILDWTVSKRYCSGKVNLGFLLDGSHHVSAREFEHVKFVLDALVYSVMPHNYGESDTTLKVGIALYGDEYEKVLGFESEQTITSFSLSVRDMELQNAKRQLLNAALNRTLDSYKNLIQNEDRSKDFKIDSVLFIAMFSTPDDDFVALVEDLQELGVRVIVLSVGSGPSDVNLKKLFGKRAQVHYVSDVVDFIESYEMGMEVIDAICEGETYPVPETTASTKMTATTPKPTSTTSVFVPDEMCTMRADLVVIIDAQLLKNSAEENKRFLLLMKSILSETLIGPDRTHVTLLLSDSRIWRVGRFISTRQQLLEEFEEALLTKIRTEVFQTQSFDLNFALDTALDGYLLNDKSGVRLFDLNVHKSILILHEREADLPDDESMASLADKLERIAEDEIVLNIITQKGTFSDRKGKNAWRRAIATKNLLFVDMYQSEITQTRFNRIMDRVCRTPPDLPMPKMFCEGHTDVYFLWDDSENIASADLKNMMKATRKIAGSLKLENFGSNEDVPMRIAIAQYSTLVNFLLDINQQDLLKSFITNPSSNAPEWSLGDQSNLGSALSEVATRFGILDTPRNKTVVVFTSKTSSDDLADVLRSLDAMGVKRVVVGFAPDTNVKELERIAGETGYHRRIASSREILDNDLGMAIAEQICIPTEPTIFPTTPPAGTTVPVTRPLQTTESVTHPLFSIGTLPPAACSMTSDILMIIDGQLTSENPISNLTSLILKQIISELEIGEKPRTSRVGIMVVDQIPSVVANIEKQGSNKRALLDSLSRLGNINRSDTPSPYLLVKAIQMSNDFIFDVRLRHEEEFDVQTDILLVTDRLPEHEVDLFRGNSLESVRINIQDLIEQDFNVYILYTNNTFDTFSNKEEDNWLLGLRDRSFLLEETDNPEHMGSEILDTICSVATKVTTTGLYTTLIGTTKQPVASPEVTTIETPSTEVATELQTPFATPQTTAVPSVFTTESKTSTTSPPPISTERTTTTQPPLTLSTSTEKFITTSRPEGCYMDIEIIVDSSYSIGPAFSHIKNFLTLLVDELDIDNDVARLGIVQYSGGVEDEFQMTDFISNSDGMKDIISNMSLLLGTTNTFSAIDYVLDNKISTEAGKRGSVPLIMLLLTDGRIKDLEKKESVLKKLNFQRSLLGEAGTFLNMIAIGFGSADQDELLQIADNGMYLEESKGFSHLKFVRNISTFLCNFRPRPYVPTTPDPTTISTTPFPVCGNMPPSDILFVLDGSFDMFKLGRIEIYRDFLKQMASKFKIGPNDTQIGVSFYSDGVYREYPNGFGITRFADAENLQEAVSNLELTSRMAFDVIESLNQILTNDFSARSDVQRVAVVLLLAPADGLDGKTIQDVFREAIDEHTELVVLLGSDFPEMNTDIGVSIGPVIENSRKLLIEGGFSRMSQTVDELQDLICQFPEMTSTSTAQVQATTIKPMESTSYVSAEYTKPQTTEMSPISPQSTGPITSTVVPPGPCSVRSDTLFVLDRNIFNTSSEAQSVIEYLSRIERGVNIEETFTRLGMLIAPYTDILKSIDSSGVPPSELIQENVDTLSGGTAEVIDIGQTLNRAMEIFESVTPSANDNRYLVLILESDVGGTITATQWLRMNELGINMIVISINSKFLRSGSPEIIPFYEIPIFAIEYLPRAADSTIIKLCTSVSTTPRTPEEPTTSAPPQLVCPPGDVVMMNDAMFLRPGLEHKMKEFLKNLVNLLSNTYTNTKTRFSLVSFGNEPELHFPFSVTRTPAQVNRLIDESAHDGVTSFSNAATALNFVMEGVVAHNTRQYNESVTLTIMMLMARSSNEDLIPVVQDIQGKADLITFAVGYDEPNLERYTTVSYGGVPARDVDHLKNLEYETLELICSKVPQPTTFPYTTSQPTTRPKHPCKVDIVFMIDENLLSSTRTAENVKTYVNRIARYLVFGDDFFRVNVKKFSEASEDVVMDGFADNLVRLQADLNANLAASPVTGTLSLKNGLEDAVVEFENHGRKVDDLARMVIFVLRRRPGDVPDLKRMNNLRDEGVMVFTVVVDDALSAPRNSLTNHNRGYIRAYRPQYLANFAPTIVYFLWNAVCARRPFVPPPQTTASSTTPKIPGVCYRVMDVTYVVDSDILVDQYERDNVKYFIKDTIRAFVLGERATRISLMQYGSVAHPVINLRSVYSIKDAFKAIETKFNVPYQQRPSKSYVSSSLLYAARYILRADGVRDADKFIVLLAKNPFTDNSYDLQSAGNLLKKLDIKLVTLASGSMPSKQISALDSEKVFTFETIDELPTFLPTVVDALCEITEKYSTTTSSFVPFTSTTTTTPGASPHTTPLYLQTTSEMVEIFSPFPKTSYAPHTFSATTTAVVTEKEETFLPTTFETVSTAAPESTTGFIAEKFTPRPATVTTTPFLRQETDCSTLKLDLLIMLQATDHFAKFGAQQMKTFVNSLSRNFKFGKDDVLTSVLQFNDNVISGGGDQDGFDFQHAKVRSMITEAIFHIHISGGNETNPGLALNNVIQNHLTASHGARDGIRKAIIFVMGGTFKEDTVREFNQAVREAIQQRHSVFVLAIPEAKSNVKNAQDFLKRLDQLPAENKIFALNGFRDISNRTMINDLAERVCQDVPYVLPAVTTTTKMPTTTTTPGIPIATTTEYFATTAIGTQTHASRVTTITPPEICPYDINLALVVDVTNLGEENLGIVKEFLLLILEQFEVAANHTNIAIVTYGTNPDVLWRFSDEQTFASVSRRVGMMKSLGKVTNTGSALQITSELFGSARTDTPWVVALITDARSKDDVRAGAMNLKAMQNSHEPGMKIVAIGLESSSPDQLSQIADENSVVYVDHYNHLLTGHTVRAAFDLLCEPYIAPTIPSATTIFSAPESSTVPIRMTTITSALSTEICTCYWTDFISRKTPSVNDPGDDESWVFTSSAELCGPEYQVFDLQCQSTGEYLQSNVECDLYKPSPICYNFEVNDGTECFDYSISVRCCLSSCVEVPTVQPTIPTSWRCSQLMDVVFVVDSTLTDEMLRGVKRFIGRLSTKMKFGPEHARSSIVAYGSRDSLTTFSWTDDIIQMKKSVDSITKTLPGTSDVAKPLKVIAENISHVSRSDFDEQIATYTYKTVIVFVSGSTVGMVDGLVGQLVSSSFQIIVVGIGSSRRNLVNRLASNTDFIFMPKSNAELVNQTSEHILKILCGELPETTLPEVEKTTITSSPPFIESTTDFTLKTAVFSTVAVNFTKPYLLTSLPESFATTLKDKPTATMTPRQQTASVSSPNATTSVERPQTSPTTTKPSKLPTTPTTKQPDEVSQVATSTSSTSRTTRTSQFSTETLGTPKEELSTIQPTTTEKVDVVTSTMATPGKPSTQESLRSTPAMRTSPEFTRKPPTDTSPDPKTTQGLQTEIVSQPPYTEIVTTTSTKTPSTTRTTSPTGVPSESPTQSIPTTTPFSGCRYYDDVTLQTRILEVGQVIYPKQDDACFSLRCVGNDAIQFDNKRLICENQPKPTCTNHFDPVLRYDESCNCQWECQCYCQASSSVVHTFDGLTYPAEGDCEQTLVKSSNRAEETGRGISLTITKKFCGLSRCITQATLIWGGDELTLQRNLSAQLNGVNVVTLNGRMKMDIVGEHGFAVSVEEIGLVLKFEPERNGISISLPGYLWEDDTQGMCGTCNHVLDDEITLSNGSVTDDIPAFINDWTIGEKCNITEREPCVQTDQANHCDMIKSGNEFEECRARINWESYYNACLEETCKRPGADCEGISTFAEACRHEGVCVEWRSDTICPMRCSENRIFKPCAFPPYEKSCEELETMQQQSLDIVKFAEGCFLNCTENEIVLNGSCASEENCFKCFDDESHTFRKPGEFWVPMENKCSICACLDRNLTIRCEPKTCDIEPVKPICGACEKVSLKANTDPCCPEYKCECDYEQCEPVFPTKGCTDGEVLSLTNETDTCLPIYNCTCDLERCTIEEPNCDLPMVATEVEWTCCPKQKCLCPEDCENANVECELGFTRVIHNDICNCSTITCEKMPVCLIHHNNHKMMKTEGEIWTDQENPCLSCTCEKQAEETYNATCTDNSIFCESCLKGFAEKHAPDECCPHCVQDACIIVDLNNATTIREVGDTWPKDECSNMTCIMERSHPIIVEVESRCNKSLPPSCDFGYKMKCSNNPCCPDCQCVPEDVCIYNDSVIQRPGNSWTIETCTSCQCTYEKDQRGFNVYNCTTLQCDACEEGFAKRHRNDTCCDECVPTVCKLQLSNETEPRVLKIGDEVREKCSLYSCVEDDTGFAVLAKVNVSCPKIDRDDCVRQGGSIHFDEKGCCTICKFDERECQVRMGSPMNIAVENCATDRAISVPYCAGQCSSSVHYRHSARDFAHYCTCCKPIVYENRTESATCTDGTKTEFSYRFVTQCSCERVTCTEWTTYKDSGEIISFKSLPSQDSSKTVIMSWPSNPTLNVVEISDVSSANDVDTFSIMQQMVDKYGLQDLAFEVVQMSAKNSTFRASLMKALDFSRSDEHGDLAP